MSGLLRAVEEVEKLDKDLNTKVGLVDNIRTLIERFPDLMIYRPEHNNQYELVCCSSAVNSYVDNYDYMEVPDFNGPPNILVWPYTLITGPGMGNMKVYSNPPYFTIGAVNTKGFGVNLDADWEDRLSSDNIALSVIRKIRIFMRSKPPINYTE